MRCCTLALLLLGLALCAQFHSVSCAPKKGGASSTGSAYVEDDDDEDAGDDEPVKSEQQWKPPPPVPDQGKAKKAEGGSRKAGGGKAGKAAPAKGAYDDDDEDLDEDEFEVSGKKATQPPPAQPEQVVGADGKARAKRRSLYQAFEGKTVYDFPYECAALVALVLYLTNYFHGSSRNKSVANKWLDANMEALEENFAYIGIDDAHKFVNEAADEYHLYCSGRQNCESMTVVVKTAPRHCAFTMIYQLLTSKMTEDTVTFEVLMGETGETGGNMDELNFVVCNKREEACLRADNTGLESFVAVRKWKTDLHESLMCLGDEEDLSREFLTKEVSATISELRHYFRSVYASGGKLMAGRVVFRMIDKCATYRHSNAAMNRMKSVKAKLAELDFKKDRHKREEAAQARRLEKLQKEKDSIKALSPEDRAKAEEKLRKKEHKDTLKARTKTAR